MHLSSGLNISALNYKGGVKWQGSKVKPLPADHLISTPAPEHTTSLALLRLIYSVLGFRSWIMSMCLLGIPLYANVSLEYRPEPLRLRCNLESDEV